MSIAREEIFGPVLSVLPFSGEEEAAEIANDSNYGLAAGIFTSDIDRAMRFARDIQAGYVMINEYFTGGPGSPSGGYKQSGREDSWRCKTIRRLRTSWSGWDEVPPDRRAASDELRGGA